MNPLSLKRELAFDVLLVVIQRALVILLMTQVLGYSLHYLSLVRDGDSYSRMASFFHHWNFIHSQGSGDLQYFLGYPFILSLFYPFLSTTVAAYTLQFTFLVATVFLMHLVFQKEWLTRYFMLVIPSYVFFSTLNMSESLLIALIFALLLAIKSSQPILTGLLFGIALTIRPQTVCFLYLIVLGWFLFKRQWQAMLWSITIPTFTLGTMFLFNHLVLGDLFINFRQYNEHSDTGSGLLALPFQNLIRVSLGASLSIWTKAYVWFCSLFALTGLVLLGIQVKRGACGALEKILLYWGGIVYVFYMSVGNWWGFTALPRYLIPVFIPAFLGFEPYMPRKWSVVLFFAGFSVLFSLLAQML